LSNGDIARALHCSQSYTSRLQSNERPAPRLATLIGLATVLDLDPFDRFLFLRTALLQRVGPVTADLQATYLAVPPPLADWMATRIEHTLQRVWGAYGAAYPPARSGQR
jgi:transcriptional regulator with XRE-family HTH domain